MVRYRAFFWKLNSPSWQMCNNKFGSYPREGSTFQCMTMPGKERSEATFLWGKQCKKSQSRQHSRNMWPFFFLFVAKAMSYFDPTSQIFLSWTYFFFPFVLRSSTRCLVKTRLIPFSWKNVGQYSWKFRAKKTLSKKRVDTQF